VATFAEIMDALAEQLEDLLPVSDYALHIEPRAFSVAEVPAIDMLIANPTGLEEGLAGFGTYSLYGAFPITLRVRVSTADLDTGENILLGLIDDEGPLSIVAALDSDRTLGGVCDDLTWGHGFPWSGYTDFPDLNGDGIFLGSTMPIVVVKTQS